MERQKAAVGGNNTLPFIAEKKDLVELVIGSTGRTSQSEPASPDDETKVELGRRQPMERQKGALVAVRWSALIRGLGLAVRRHRKLRSLDANDQGREA